MGKRHLVVLFIILVIIQLAVPLNMIIQREITLSKGNVHNFKMTLIDPYDPFRGRYVDIVVENNFVIIEKNEEYGRGEVVYITLKKDKDGYTAFKKVYREAPHNEEYIKTKITYVDTWSQEEPKAYFQIPFDRYYMEEKAAPIAEQKVLEHLQKNEENVYVAVRIRKGMAVIESLFVGERTIEEMVKTRDN
ncbi:GDYXXLXY domain-containing protein [Natronincola ferrireducens]|uniref:Uncharacterized membrane-anchored protein n=1 Tax=Natronincola ferrireducens TaxID=393762 RepID=A0A1G9GMT3_9FIRM|nr:GDYXXLXY domain-containing protein [Natronincola ferrireducens]SDL01795.1 Uncharacterized membrane-anchored protein [Natronincola ferrireducens]